MSNWRPLFARFDSERAKEYDALHEGVPPWIAKSIIDSIRSRIDRTEFGYSGTVHLAASILKGLERRLRVSFNWQNGDNGAFQDAINQFLKRPDLLLAGVDALLWDLGDPTDNGAAFVAAGELEQVLVEGASVWAVRFDASQDRLQLTRRVSEEVESTLAATSDRAGQYLRQSWARAFGRQPVPDGAYRDAVRALESALKPVVSPKNDVTTLGTVIRDIRLKPEKWRVRLQPSNGDPVIMFAEELQMLWNAQLDRHGTDDESVPLNVTIEQAQDCVVRAASLIHLVQSGGFRPA